MNLAPIIKTVRAYDATEWEIFVSEWQKGLLGYHSVKRLGGAGDHGRDVIGLCDANGCEGIWDNYQCKHYDKMLAVPVACEDAGKIIFHAYRKRFKAPRRCIFVAPRGPTTELRDLLLNPSKFKRELIATWDARVAGRVVAGEVHKLTGDLRDFAEAYDFAGFGYSTLEDILDGHRRTAYWSSRFGGLLPAPPKGKTPTTVAASETIYVGRLLEVYAEETGADIESVLDLIPHPEWQRDLQRQRERFYDAEAFMAHYRDQTEPGTIEDFADQIYDAIEPGLALES